MINPFLTSKTYQELQQALTDGVGPLGVTGTVEPVKAQLLTALCGKSEVHRARTASMLRKEDPFTAAQSVAEAEIRPAAADTAEYS